MKQRARGTALLLIGAILFQHFQLFTVSTYAVTLGFALTVPLILSVTQKFRISMITIIWFLIITLTGAAALFNQEGNTTQYFGTLALFLVSTLIVVSSLGCFDTGFVRSLEFSKALCFCLVLLSLLSVGQVVLGSLGWSGLFNVFRDHQYLYQYNPQLAFVKYPRASGLFLEPSYNAFVISALTVSLLSLGRHVRISIVFGVSGVFAAQSATGLILLAVVLGISVFKNTIARGILASLLGVSIYFVAGNYLSARLASIDTTGSSAYYRLVAPLPILKDVLTTHPLGMTLGSVHDVVSGYQLQMAGNQASSLDNGIYVLIFYFGWVGLLLFLAAAIASIHSASHCAHDRRSLRWIAPLWLVASLLFSGGIMAPEFALMTWLVIIAFRANQLNGDIDYDMPGDTPQRNSGHLQGSRGVRAHAEFASPAEAERTGGV